VIATFDPKAPAKTSAAVAHERLPDPDEAEGARAAWWARLGALKVFLEGAIPSSSAAIG
jgi:hypothetical protein